MIFKLMMAAIRKGECWIKVHTGMCQIVHVFSDTTRPKNKINTNTFVIVTRVGLRSMVKTK